MRCRVPPPLFTPVRPFPISPSIPHSPPHFPHTPFPITPHFPTPHFPEPPPFPITPHVPPPPVSPITPRSPTPLPPNVGGRAIKVGVFIASCFCCGGFFWGGGAGLVGGGAQWGADGRTNRTSHWLLTGRGRGLPLPSPLAHWSVTRRGRDQGLPSAFHWTAIREGGRVLVPMSPFHLLANDRKGAWPVAHRLSTHWPAGRCGRGLKPGSSGMARRGVSSVTATGEGEGRVTFDPRRGHDL